MPFVMSCGGFFVCLKSMEEIISRTEVQGHRIFFSAGKDRYGRSRLHRKAALSHRVPEKSPDFLGKGGAVKQAIFRACTEMSDTEPVTTCPQR